MSRRILGNEPSQAGVVSISDETLEPVTSGDLNNNVNEEETSNDEFQVEYNQDEGIVSFALEDGTSVVMKSPKTRQFLLLESFIKSADPEYRTESFVATKLASLCVIKFGTKEKVTFDELLDNLSMNDLERVAAGLSFFRGVIESITNKRVGV